MHKTIKYLIMVTLLGVVLLVILAVIRSGTSGYPSAYSACKDVAMHTKSWGIWVYQREEQHESSANVIFSDGTNTLSCPAVQIGSLWYADAGKSFQSMVGIVCPEDSSEYPCPKWDYHGVNP